MSRPANQPTRAIHDSRTFRAPPNRRFTDAEVQDIRRRVAAGERQTEIAREKGVRKDTICRLVHGDTYSQPLALDEALARVTSDPIRLYREERQAAQARLKAKQTAVWAAVESAWTRLKEREERSARGGRPKGRSVSVGRGADL